MASRASAGVRAGAGFAAVAALGDRRSLAASGLLLPVVQAVAASAMQRAVVISGRVW
ncbi:hypothetical protein [Streptomyces sp. NPDC088246]|uniref:hypothetical protein n=1 Tax=Streptomyces sp. NPDC088246 TaxID=3365842 RepID=UPI0038154E63